MEELKEDCGVALIRLLKPLSYYQEKYDAWMYKQTLFDDGEAAQSWTGRSWDGMCQA